mmetsp:Transcript_31938/g.72867  ORF Transcript_31938/g.72867 Transcript_31938/m.72867 type:complete len:333 (-) Transcript_31938:26-1024(-)
MQSINIGLDPLVVASHAQHYGGIPTAPVVFGGQSVPCIMRPAVAYPGGASGALIDGRPSMPNPWPEWYNRDLQPIPVDNESLTSDSTGSSSSSSSSSSDTSEDKGQSMKQNHRGASTSKRYKWRLKCRVQGRLTSPPRAPLQFELMQGARRRRTFVHVPRLLSPEAIDQVHALWRHPSVNEIRDRKGSLLYRHVAYRMELPLRAHARPLYNHLIGAMFWADALVWKKIGKNKVVYPEVEYIVYDARQGSPGEIEPHVDNHSAVSIVVLLSDPSDFEGGANCFVPAQEHGGAHRELSLKRGDAVLFRGEKLRHWITPVVSGVRIILQIELSRV